MVSYPCHLWKRLLPGDMTPVDALGGVQSLLQTEPGKNSALSGVGRVGVHKHPLNIIFPIQKAGKMRPHHFWILSHRMISFAPGCPTLPTSDGTGTNWQPHDGCSDTVERFAWNWKNKTPFQPESVRLKLINAHVEPQSRKKYGPRCMCMLKCCCSFSLAKLIQSCSKEFLGLRQAVPKASTPLSTLGALSVSLW